MDSLAQEPESLHRGQIVGKGSWFRLARRMLWLAILGVVLALVAPQAIAAYHFRRGEAELGRYHSEEALAHFEAALRTWPDDEECRLWASRAARRLGRYDVAEAHLQHGQDRRPSQSPQLTFEWSCLRASQGDLLDVESYL